MKPFFSFFARRELLANVLLIMVILLGVNALTKMKRDTYPKVDMGEVVINTQYPGASAADVEINVTNKIEDKLSGIIGIKKMISESAENVSQIQVVIDPDDDIDAVVEDIKNAVDQVRDLPVEVDQAPQIVEIKTAIFPVLEVGIIPPDGASYAELRTIAAEYERKLKQVQGVSRVEKFGFYDREVSIHVDPTQLNRYQLSLDSIASAIQRRNIRATNGVLESYANEKNIVTLSQFRQPLDVSDVIVRSTFSSPQVRVKDVASVTDGFKEPTIISRMNGFRSISMVVYKSETADVIRTVDAIKTMLAANDVRLPDGYRTAISTDISRYVRNRLTVVMSNAVIGLVFVVGLLSLFFSLRTAFWVSVGIPVSLLGVFAAMPLFGAYIEVVSLASLVIVIGIIVDDAIIISENIVRRRELGDSPIDAAVNGISEVAKPVLTTILTTFVAFAPMFFMKGVMGKFVFVIPLVISLALFISLLEVTIGLPAHLVPGLGKLGSGKRTKSHWFDLLRESFRHQLSTVLRFRWLISFTFVGLLAYSLFYAWTQMDFKLFSTKAADAFFVYVDLPVGSSLDATHDKVKAVEAVIRQLPDDELDSFVSRIGTSGDSITNIDRENKAMIIVSLTPFNQRQRDADAIIESLRQKTANIPGVDSIRYSVDASGPPVGKPIEIQVVGNHDQRRTQLADAISLALNQLPGVVDVNRSDQSGKPHIEIVPNYSKLARVGLTVSDVSRAARLAYDGQTVTTARYGDEDVDFTVMLDPSVRQTLQGLASVLIPNQSGQLISLRSIASFQSSNGPSNYLHYDGQRAIKITGEIEKGKNTVLSVTKAIQDQFDMDSDWSGLELVWGGESEESKESMINLFKAFGVAAVGIFFLLLLLFQSISQPFLVLLAIPFGFMGIVLTFALHGEALGFMAMLGIVGMSGVVVNDSLVLINRLNRLNETHSTMPILDRVALGTSDRLRSISITTLTTVAGLLPLAYGIGGSDPFMAPMALALGYGILFATPLTLLLLPCLYLIFDDIGQFFISRFR